MTYLRNPHYPFMWESDGEFNGKFAAKDGTLFDNSKEADEYDKDPKMFKARQAVKAQMAGDK